MAAIISTLSFEELTYLDEKEDYGLPSNYNYVKIEKKSENEY